MGQDDKQKMALAMQLLSKREYAQSEQIFKGLIDSGSELAESFYGMGMIRLSAGQTIDAIEQFENCLRLQPSHANANYYLGHIAEQRQDKEGAKSFYERVLEINPTHAGALKKLVGNHKPEEPRAEVRQTESDLYALFRRSTAPVEQEIARRFDAIATEIGTRRARLRAFIGPPLLLLSISFLLMIGAITYGNHRSMNDRGASENFAVFLLLASILAVISLISLLAVWLRARNSNITCERDWLVVSRGVLSKSTQNRHLFDLSRGQISVHQTLLNRMTSDGDLSLAGLSMYGFFRKPELHDLLVHFRQLSLLNPTSREVLAALGELKNIRSGAN